MDINLILSIIGIVFGILSLVLGYMAIKYQKPVFIKETSNIIDSEIIEGIIQTDPNLKISYIGEPITNLSSTCITLWNAGNIRINNDDIPKNTPVWIMPKNDVKIYRLSLINVKPENAFRTFLNPSPTAPHTKFYFTFEYLGKNEGQKIQLIHSGKSSDDIDFFGKTKDSGNFVDVSNQERNGEKFYQIGAVFGSILITAFIVYLSTIIPLTPFLDFLHTSNLAIGSLFALFLLIIISVIAILFPYALILNIIVQYKYPKIPKDLR
ncbi:MAG: hypothetical protein WC626_07050 [Methanoregula sp.]